MPTYCTYLALKSGGYVHFYHATAGHIEQARKDLSEVSNRWDAERVLESISGDSTKFQYYIESNDLGD